MEEACAYEIEEILNHHLVFYRIHKTDISNHTIIPGAFKSRVDGMSVNWNKYSTAQDLKDTAKTPADNGIVSFNVGEVRANEALSVEHNPIVGNQAHSLINGIPLIKGDLQVKTRLFLKRLYTWEIKINEEDQ